MKKVALTVVFVAVAFLSAERLVAQDLSRFSLEGRFGVVNVPGAGFLEIGKGNHFSAGFLVSYRPSADSESFLSRLTFRGSLDGAGLGGEDIQIGIKSTERLYLVNFALGLDAVQTPRFTLTLHGGGAISRDHFAIQEFSPFGGSLGTGGFVGACNIAPDICDSIWNFLGNEGIEARYVPKASWPNFFVGADYTYFAGAKHQTVFTTGINF